MADPYFRLQMSHLDAHKNRINKVEEVLKQNKITASRDTAGEAFDDLEPTTIILIHKSGSPIALVEIISKIDEEDRLEPSYGIDYSVKILGRFDEDKKKYPDINKLWGTVPFQGTFSILHPGNSATYKNIDIWYKSIQATQKMQSYIDLLESNKNLILTGAPGTGKTYLAKGIAAQITETNCIQFVQFHPSYDYTDFVEGLRPVKKEDELGFELRNGIFKAFCKQAKDNPTLKYVFIIDEINRAEISKVFGELFFALDAGYRGKEGVVSTQYANIQTDDTIFDIDLGQGKFYIPKNVYIIGTMNDIDRSVESFDFAIRRRFAWKEITPNERVEMWDGKIDTWKVRAKQKMEVLNTEISGINGLGTAFQLGPAYFLKLELYKGDFTNLWENHIGVLLKEYLRGMPEADSLLENLKTIYDK